MEQKLTELLELFDERDDVFAEISEIIVSELEDTLFMALRTLLQSSKQDTQCTYIDIIDEDISIVCSVTYQDPSFAPDFIKQSEAFVISGKEYRTVRLTMPLDVVFKTSAEILEYLKRSQMYIVDGEDNVTESKVSLQQLDPEFDENKLSVGQQLQAMFFEGTGKGTKH